MSYAKSIATVIFCISIIFLATSLSLAASSGTAQVQLRETSLRATPSFLGKVTAILHYGDRVTITQERGGWMKVIVSGTRKEGWLHGSAITSKALVLRSGTQAVKTGATGREVALAGKGFSEQVEAEFKKKNRNLDFTWVDRMESFTVTPLQIQAFYREGGLLYYEGGAQ